MTRDAIRCAAAADTMRDVRDRCVWTQQIDHRALVPYLVEESAELIDAVEDGSRAELREELGDLLWQVLFHAEIASRDPDEPFDIDDVARGLTEKMVRRHPHVFADEVATTPERCWCTGTPRRPPRSTSARACSTACRERMPSLALAQKLLGKAAQVGVEQPRAGAEQPRHDRGRARRRAARPRRDSPARTGGMPSGRSASGSRAAGGTRSATAEGGPDDLKDVPWHPSIRRAACATSSPPRRPAASACSPSSASAIARTASTRSRPRSWRSTRGCTPASAATTRSSPTTCSSAASTPTRSVRRPTIPSALADLGLRYDLTVPLARFYASHRAELPAVFRAIQIAPVWRAERPQKGRYRQFVQCDIDIIGDASARAEAELIVATLDTVDALGLEGATVRINDRRALDWMLDELRIHRRRAPRRPHHDRQARQDRHRPASSPSCASAERHLRAVDALRGVPHPPA